MNTYYTGDYTGLFHYTGETIEKRRSSSGHTHITETKCCSDKVAQNDIEEKKIPTYRRLMPQILASATKYLLLFNLGLAGGISTIIIPALTRIQSSLCSEEEPITITAEQSTWIGSIPFIFQPVGCILSGWITESVGRKKSLFFFNISTIIAWLLLYFSKSLIEIYIAVALLGFGAGLMEGTIITYIAEICEPSVYKILITFATLAGSFGTFIMYFLAILTTWRNIAIICVSIPIFSTIVIAFLPETPIWLLSKKRDAKALKSLKWLRGWVSSTVVGKEFEDMKNYSNQSNSCGECAKENIHCSHCPVKMMDKFMDLFKKSTLKSVFLIIACFFFSQFSSYNAIRPYVVQIFKSFDTGFKPEYATLGIGLTVMIANIICVLIIQFIGRRNLALFSTLGSAISCLTLGYYAKTLFPDGFSTFNNHHENSISDDLDSSNNIFPAIFLLAIGFFYRIGISIIPWILLAELLPIKVKGLATGLIAAISCLMNFITVKTFFNIESLISLSGFFFLYGGINILGMAYSFFILPEASRIEFLNEPKSDQSDQPTIPYKLGIANEAFEKN